MPVRTPRCAVLSLAALFCAICALSVRSATAQDGDQPAAFHLAAELTPMDGRSFETLEPGDRLFLSARLVNVSDAVLQVRRVAATGSDAMRFEDPQADGLDNDANGLIDDPREGLVEITAENTLLWTLSGSDAGAHPPVTIAPGAAAIWRAQAIATQGISTDALGASVSFIASSRDNGLLKLSRLDAAADLNSAPFEAQWRTLAGAAPKDSVFSHGDAARWRLEMTLPPGFSPDLAISIAAPQSVRDLTLESAHIGSNAACLNGSEPRIADGRATWVLGDCMIDAALGARQGENSRIALELSGVIVDTDAFAHSFNRASHRYDRMEAIFSAEGRPFQRLWSLVRVQGPVLRVAPLENFTPPPESFRAGDFLRHRFRVRNVGDEAAGDVVMWLQPHPALNCAFARLDPIDRASVRADAPDNACGQAIGLGAATALESGDSLVVEVSASTMSDAPLGAPAMLALGVSATALRGAAARVDSRAVSIAPEAPVAAAFSAADAWTTQAGDLTIAPLQTRRVRMEMSLPPGRTPLAIEVRSRLLDAQTGAPIGPADLQIAKVSLVEAETGVSMAASPELAEAFGPASTLQNGWRVLRAPLGVVGYETRGLDRQLFAVVEIDLAAQDAPEVRRGRVVQITGALVSATQTVHRAPETIEAVIVEPKLSLAASTIDSNGIIAASDMAAFLAEACNVGDAPAYGVSLSSALSEEFVNRPPDQVAFQIRNRASDARIPVESELTYTPSEQMLTGALELDRPLDPGFCLRLALRAQAAASLPEDGQLGAKFHLTPYYNHPSPEASRVYPVETAQTSPLWAPSLQFGPLRRGAVKAGDLIQYESILLAPPAGGPFEIKLNIDSSADLIWAFEAGDSLGEIRPWRDGLLLESGGELLVRGAAVAPRRMPPGWIDTTVLRAVAESVDSSGAARAASLNWVTVADDPLSAQIVTEKLMALDRNCNGGVEDETAQDALLEAFKQVVAGECVVFHIAFQNAGDTAMEQITIRDSPPAGTIYIPRSQGIFENPKTTTSPDYHQGEDGVLVWDFMGSYPPGASGAVQYSVIVEGA